MRLQPLLRSQRFGLIAAAILLLSGLIGLIAVSVLAETGAADQAITGAAGHRATVDAAMALFLSPSDPNQSQEPDAIRAESERRLSLYQDALAEVASGSARLKQIVGVMGWLGPVAFSKSAEVATARQRAQIVVAGLFQARDVLTAAVDQEILGRALFEATLKENDMLDAVRSRQYAEADRIDAQADAELLVAESRVLSADEPPDMRLLVGSLRAMVDATDKLALDLLRRDGQDQLRQEELRQAIRDFSQFSSEAQLARFRDWNRMTFEPKIAAYDAALQ